MEEEKFCPFEGCNRYFEKPSKLKIHIRSHTGDRPFTCTAEGCTKAFTRADHLKRHIITSHEELAIAEDVQQFSCEECGKSFKLKHHLQRHIKTHQTPRPYLCPIDGCSDAFVKKTHLRAHLQFSHSSSSDASNTPLPVHFCPYEGCGRSFLSAREMSYHRVSEHEDGGRFICGHVECSAAHLRFGTKKELLEHMRVSHSDHFECDECGKKFGSRKNLRTHERNVHEVPRLTAASGKFSGAFTCEVCDKEFASVHIYYY